jgi:Concanavalin A-like lectin/glucanases superfamily
MDFGNGQANSNIILARNATSSTINVTYMNGGTSIISFDNTSAISLNQWQYFVVTVDASKVVSVYKDGTLLGSTTASAAIPSVMRTNNYIGRSNWSSDSYYAGRLDEARLSIVARSADWIATEYNNQNSPSTFVSVGSDQTP